MIAYIPVFGAIIGGIIYFVSPHPKIARCREITFAASMFALMFEFASHTTKLF